MYEWMNSTKSHQQQDKEEKPTDGTMSHIWMLLWNLPEHFNDDHLDEGSYYYSKISMALKYKPFVFLVDSLSFWSAELKVEGLNHLCDLF